MRFPYPLLRDDEVQANFEAIEFLPSFMAYGLVSAAGSILSGSNNFSVKKEAGEGEYLIVWSRSLTTPNYTAIVSLLQGAFVGTAEVNNMSEANMLIGIHKENPLKDSAFSFLVMVP